MLLSKRLVKTPAKLPETNPGNHPGFLPNRHKHFSELNGIDI